MVDKYEEQSDKYVEEKVKAQKLDNTFADIKTDSKSAFFESLRVFQISNPNVLSGLSTLFQTNFFRLFFRYCTGV